MKIMREGLTAIALNNNFNLRSMRLSPGPAIRSNSFLLNLLYKLANLERLILPQGTSGVKLAITKLSFVVGAVTRAQFGGQCDV